MRIVMMATGDIAIPSFQALGATGELVALITQPDRPQGRHMELTPPRIKKLAQQMGVPVYQPEKMRAAEAVEQLRDFRPDVVVVMAYGQILSQEVIDVPTIACINAHVTIGNFEKQKWGVFAMSKTAYSFRRLRDKLPRWFAGCRYAEEVKSENPRLA